MAKNRGYTQKEISEASFFKRSSPYAGLFFGLTKREYLRILCKNLKERPVADYKEHRKWFLEGAELTSLFAFAYTEQGAEFWRILHSATTGHWFLYCGKREL